MCMWLSLDILLKNVSALCCVVCHLKAVTSRNFNLFRKLPCRSLQLLLEGEFGSWTIAACGLRLEYEAEKEGVLDRA